MLCLQKLSDKFSNLAISGFNYSGFITRETKKPFNLNVHVYSGMLIKNDLKFKWRTKYNEDVDLCLQALTAKKCTLLLNVFSIDKTSTGVKMAGGNQDELYLDNEVGRKLLKSKSLESL